MSIENRLGAIKHSKNENNEPRVNGTEIFSLRKKMEESSTVELPIVRTPAKGGDSETYIKDRLTPTVSKKINGNSVNGNGHGETHDFSTPFKLQVENETTNGNGNGHHKAEKAERPDYLKGHDDAMLFSDLVKSGKMAEYYPFFEDDMDAKISTEPHTKIELNKAVIEINSKEEGSGVLRLVSGKNKEELYRLKSGVAVREASNETGELVGLKFIFPEIDDSGKGVKAATEVLVGKNGWEKRKLSRDKTQAEEDGKSLDAADKISEKWAIKFNSGKNKDDFENPNVFVSNRFAPVVPRDLRDESGK